MRSAARGIFVLTLLASACGRATQDDPQGEQPDSAGRGGVGSHGENHGGSGEAGGAASAGAGGAAGANSSPNSGGKAGHGGGAGAGGGTNPELSSVELVGSPIYTRVQRLTNRQWENAVSDLLRFEKSHQLAEQLAAPVGGVTPFDNNEKILFVDHRNARDFQLAAETAATIATESVESLARVYVGDDAAGFVRAFGRRTFRRPLAEAEEKQYLAVFALGEKLYGAGFSNGAALVIRAMLQSPHFLYRTELGAAGSPLTGYELAAKLSLWLLGTTPSDALLDSAAAGELDSDKGLEATTRAMLEDERAVAVMRDFHSQLLRVEQYETITKVGVPDFASIVPELTLASHAFFDQIYSQDFGLRELLTSRRAYVGPQLAPFYGMNAPVELEWRDVGPSRGGYFMQVPFLMMEGTDAESNPIRRGLAVQRMLCGTLPEPPADISPPPDFREGETTRQRVTRFTAECGSSCHARFIDPLGFALENFDGLGQERKTEKGQPIDTTGSYPFAEGIQSFADGNELMKIMADSAQVHTCYSKNVTSYALGRDLIESDRVVLEALAEVSLSQSLKEVIVALVREPAFRLREKGLP